MSGGEKQRDPLLFPYLGQLSRLRHATLQPGSVSFPGVATNKRPVNMRPEIMEDWIAHLDSMIETRPATGLLKSKAKAVKKKEAPILHHFDVPPKFDSNCRRLFWLLFLSAASPFLMVNWNFRRSSPIPLLKEARIG